MKKTVRTILFAAATLAAVSCGNKKTEQAAPVAEVAPSVTVVTVNEREVIQQQTFTSSVQAFAVNNIAPQSPNRIKKILVDVGDFVKEGQKVAEMDVVNLSSVKLQLINDSTELSRIKTLYQEGGVAKADYEAMELAYKVRKASYDNLLENTYLTAPISGVITARNYDEGDMYGGQPLYVVQQITPVKLLVGVSESEYTKVKKGDNVTIAADAFPGKVFNGKVNKIYPTIDPATRTFTVEVIVDNNYKSLRPGMFARVTIKFGVNNSVVIPDIAVVKQQGSGERFVYVLNEDGTVTYQKVVLGTRLGSEFEVLEGLKDGDKIVTEGHIRLKHGIKVSVKN